LRHRAGPLRSARATRRERRACPPTH
jgi:hypothetical protein